MIRTAWGGPNFSVTFNDASQVYEKIYSKLLSDKLEANLGFLYENAIAQIIKSSGRDLFSQKDIGNDGMLELKPIYLVPIIMEG